MSQIRIAIAVVVVALLSGAAPARAQQQSLTIYNDGRVLVRRTFSLAVSRGTSAHRLETGTIDPASIFSLNPSVSISRATFEGGVDEQSVLRRAIGQQLRFVTANSGKADTILATVVGIDPVRYRLADGSITFGPPGRAIYPASMVPLSPSLAVELNATQAVSSLDVGYFTSGATWQAAYSLMLEGGQANITGNAAIASDQLLAEQASVQLLAGNTGRAYPKGFQTVAVQMRDAAANAPMQEESVGEAHVYTMRQPLTLLPGQTTIASLFEPARVPYTREYFVRGGIPYYGFLPQTGDEGQVPVEILYTIPRKAGSPFGDVPLPGGIARIYEKDSGGRLQLTGEASTSHIAAGQDLRISAGTAFDITARRVQTSYTLTQDGPRGRQNVAVADYAVTISNAKQDAVVVVVEESRGGDWTIVSSSIPATRTSSTVARFRVPVPAGGEAVLTYQVRARW